MQYGNGEAMREKLQRFMMGRNGTDNLNKFLLGLTLVILIVSLFVRVNILYFIGLALLIWTYFRMLSKNISARSAENERYLRMTSGISGFFRQKKLHFQQRKIYCFYKCPSCGQEVRVPKGKGRIRITCPKCRTEFEKTT